MYCFIKYSIYALIFGRFFIKLLKFQYYFYTPLKFSSITRTKALPGCCYCVTEVKYEKAFGFRPFGAYYMPCPLYACGVRRYERKIRYRYAYELPGSRAAVRVPSRGDQSRHRTYRYETFQK